MRLRPSSADIWSNCAAQPALLERLARPNQTSDEAMEGTCAAWLADEMIRHGLVDAKDMVGEVCPENNWIVDHEMARHIQKYVDMIRERGGDIFTERKVKLNEHIQGTCDTFSVLTGDTLYVDDLKYGYGIVSPHTKQLVAYGGAIIRELRDCFQPTYIQLGVYQPRALHHDGIYRTRKLTVAEFNEEVDRLIRAGGRCQDADAFAKPGKHCKHCPVADSCSALGFEIYDIYSMVLGKAMRNPTIQELADEKTFLVRAAAMLKGRINATDAEMNARMDNGKNIPGWTRKSSKGNRRWKVSSNTVKFMTGMDPTSGAMVTPAALERLGADPDIVKTLVEQPTTKAKLVPFTAEDVARKFGEG